MVSLEQVWHEALKGQLTLHQWGETAHAPSTLQEHQQSTVQTAARTARCSLLPQLSSSLPESHSSKWNGKEVESSTPIWESSGTLALVTPVCAHQNDAFSYADLGFSSRRGSLAWWTFAIGRRAGRPSSIPDDAALHGEECCCPWCCLQRWQPRGILLQELHCKR